MLTCLRDCHNIQRPLSSLLISSVEMDVDLFKGLSRSSKLSQSHIDLINVEIVLTYMMMISKRE